VFPEVLTKKLILVDLDITLSSHVASHYFETPVYFVKWRQGSTDRQVRWSIGPSWSDIFKILLVLVQDFWKLVDSGPVWPEIFKFSAGPGPVRDRSGFVRGYLDGAMMNWMLNLIENQTYSFLFHKNTNVRESSLRSSIKVLFSWNI